jgi:hypothetical protein
VEIIAGRCVIAIVRVQNAGKMNNFHAVRMFMAAALQVAVLALASGVCANVWADDDVLAVGDESGNTVKVFVARTGQYLSGRSIAPGSGGLLGPTGIVFDRPADRYWSPTRMSDSPTTRDRTAS